MIICVSANPAMDRRVRLNRLGIGSVNRAIASESFAGGKAAHVAMAAKALGEEPVWVGFLGGSTGDELETQLNGLGITTVAVRTASKTRSNDEVIESDGTITEILEPGGEISAEELSQMFRACEEQMAVAGEGFCLVLSGSLPPGVPGDFYSELTVMARKHGGTVIVDSSGDALAESLASSPELVKPNREEAENLASLRIEDEVSAIQAVREFQELGAKAVALSLGSDGMLWFDNGGPILAKPPKVDVVSTVGCGDASVAGMAVGRIRGLTREETVRLAVACGAANCTARLPGQIDISDVSRLMEIVEVKFLSEQFAAIN